MIVQRQRFPLRLMRAALVTACLTGAAFATSSVAQAQAVQIPLPDGVLLPQQADGVPMMSGMGDDRFSPDRHRGNFVEPGPLEQMIVSPLRPIHARGRPAGSAIRFDGERRTLDFALFIPDPQAVRALRVATLSSINVLPERSRYRVFVNGTFMGEGQLGNFTEFGEVEFPLSPVAILPGQNDVRIELVQYHRIYCGPEASFALWSDIDLARSGAVLAADAGLSGQDAFMMGLAAAAATGAGIEIRGAERLADYRDDWIAQITQRISGAMGGDPIPFRTTQYWSVQGDTRSAARITFIPSAVNTVSFRTSGDGAQVMVVEFVPGQRPHSLPEFENLLPRVAARAQPTLIDTMRPVAFSEFGFESTEVRDRYTLIETRFRLPDDYVVLTNAKAEIALDYAYVPDLPFGSQLLVNVNGENVRLLPLRGQGGEVIEQFPVRFEARYLRSGVNTLAFEVMVPGAPADLPCPTIDEPMAAIGSGSTIHVPYSPSMYLPDMQMAFAGLGPDSIVLNDMSTRAFDANDVITLRAALIGGERADAAALQPRLHLLSADDLGSVPMGGHLFSRHALDEALLPQGSVPLPAEGQPMAENSLLRLQDRVETTAALSRGVDWMRRFFEDTLQWLHPRTGVLLERWLEQQRGQAVMFQLDPGRPNHLWLVRAPGSDASSIAAALVAARTTTEGPRGQVSVLGHDGVWRSWTAPDRQPLLLEPVNLGNARHVVGNFVSAMPVRYVVGLFFLALISALFALRLVIATREHKA